MDSLLSSRIPLISPKEFPVPLFREFSPNQLIRGDIPVQSESKFPANHEKFPANSHISGNSANGDLASSASWEAGASCMAPKVAPGGCPELADAIADAIPLSCV
jgi:hypothetical protein